MSSVIERAQAHFQKFIGEGRRSIEVPEWGDEKGPARIYWRPITVAERRKIFAATNVEATALVLKAEDEAGKPMFDDITDEFRLANSVDGAVVSRIVNEMVKAPTVEEAIKN